MSQSYFIVCLLVISIPYQLLVLGTPINGTVHVGSQKENEGSTLHVGPLALTELGKFDGKTYFISDTVMTTQERARSICSDAGLQLLRITGGPEEFAYIQKRLVLFFINTYIWTDYTLAQENDCYRSNGEGLPQSLTIAPASSNMYRIGLTMSRSGGFTQYTTNLGCRYICT